MTNATLDRLTALRERWRAHDQGRSAFSHALRQSYRTSVPIGRTFERFGMYSNTLVRRRLAEAIQAAGEWDWEHAWGREPVLDSTAAAAMLGHCPPLDVTYAIHRRQKLRLRPDVLTAAISYAQERVLLMDEIQQTVEFIPPTSTYVPELRAVQRRDYVQELRTWQRLRDLLEVERASAIQQLAKQPAEAADAN